MEAISGFEVDFDAAPRAGERAADFVAALFVAADFVEAPFAPDLAALLLALPVAADLDAPPADLVAPLLLLALAPFDAAALFFVLADVPPEPDLRDFVVLSAITRLLLALA